MIFSETIIPGAYIIDLERREDDRGFFARGWCQKEFEAKGLFGGVAQVNISYNKTKHTLRGFHYQTSPHQEDKLLRCTRGAVHDIVVDLRRDSPTYKQHVSLRLDADSHRMILVPKGCANAFLTLEDETEVTYLVSEFYTPAVEAGIRWNDPAFHFDWPVSTPAVISPKDQEWPNFSG